VTLMQRLLGRPLATSEEQRQRISPWMGVPVLGLDALSSAAYGPEAAMTVLLFAGTAGQALITPIMLGVIALLLVLYASYRQTIRAYPQGGGSYTVARTNLGVNAGLLAAAALVLDYVMNVAVGISAGVGALVSALPVLLPLRPELCLLLLLVIAVVNLRGVRDSGVAFMLPTVLFVLLLLGVIVAGVLQVVLTGGHPVPVVAPQAGAASAAAGLSAWLIVRAFSAGCTAMTGIEAVSNGVGSFRAPAVRNARLALTFIVGLLGVLLAGIAFLARAYGVTATDPASPEYRSVLTTLIAAVTGTGPVYAVSVAAILAVLCLSANTSFAGLPRVAKLLADDDYLPHGFASRGPRLVYTWGVVSLTLLAALLLVVFGGVTDRLVPLFAIGAFLAFTLSQLGMVGHWRRLRQRGLPLALNAFGAAASGVTLLVVLASKFTEGAWVTLLIVPGLVLAFRATHRHYRHVQAEITTEHPLDFTPRPAPIVIVPVQAWTTVTRKALRFARQLGDVRAVHVLTEQDGHDLQDRWAACVTGPAAASGAPAPTLVLLESPYRQLLEPLLDYVHAVEQDCPDRQVVVLVPELVGPRLTHSLLHNTRSAVLKARLSFGGDRRVVVMQVPWSLDDTQGRGRTPR